MFGDLFGNLEEQQNALKEQLSQIFVTENAEDGAIFVTADANRTITNISIDPEKLDLSDSEQLEDLLMVAINRVLEQAAAKEAEASQKLVQDMLPPGMGGLFGRG